MEPSASTVPDVSESGVSQTQPLQRWNLYQKEYRAATLPLIQTVSQNPVFCLLPLGPEPFVCSLGQNKPAFGLSLEILLEFSHSLNRWLSIGAILFPGGI